MTNRHTSSTTTPTGGPVAQAIRAKLVAAFDPSHLEIVDDSHRHAGHMGYKGDDAETHFNVSITAAAFDGMARVARQRAVYKVLADELAGPVHALALDIKAPSA